MVRPIIVKRRGQAIALVSYNLGEQESLARAVELRQDEALPASEGQFSFKYWQADAVAKQNNTQVGISIFAVAIGAMLLNAGHFDCG